MSKIAKKLGVTLDDLLAANKATIPNPDKIKIGDQVIVPSAQAAPTAAPVSLARPRRRPRPRRRTPGDTASAARC